MVAYAIFKEPPVRFFHPLGKIAEEHEGWNHRILKHGHIFNLNILAFVGRGGRDSNLLEHIVIELGSRDDAPAILINFHSRLEDIVDALLRECGCKNYGKVSEWGEPGADSFLETFLSLETLILDKIPFIYAYHESFPVSLDKAEYVRVLALDSSRRIYHQDTHI